MILKLWSNLQLKVYLSKEEKRTGICSQEYANPEKHCVLWDFDNAELSVITKQLIVLQDRYKLPNIYIFESSLGNYHAYCFASRTFREAICILADTPNIDMRYLQLGMVRGYFTLRISPRNGKEIKYIATLLSIHSEEISRLDLTINDYFTSNKGGNHDKG